MNGDGRWLHSGPEKHDHPENISQGGIACWSADAHPICLMLRIEMKGVVDGYTWDQKIRITQKTLRRWQEPAYRLSALQRRKATRKSEQEGAARTIQCLPESGIIITPVILSGLNASTDAMFWPAKAKSTDRHTGIVESRIQACDSRIYCFRPSADEFKDHFPRGIHCSKS